MRSKKAAAGKGTVSDELGGRKPEGSADKISVSLKNRKTAKKVETKSGGHYKIVTENPLSPQQSWGERSKQ